MISVHCRQDDDTRPVASTNIISLAYTRCMRPRERVEALIMCPHRRHIPLLNPSISLSIEKDKGDEIKRELLASPVDDDVIVII